MRETLYTRALRRASELLGGENVLAARLRVSRTAVTLWMSGLAGVPDDVFLKVVDLLLERKLSDMRAPPPRDPSSSDEAR